MSAEIRRELTKLRRRRGVTRSSITRLDKRLDELETLSSQPNTIEHAKELSRKLESLDSEYKTCHFEIVDLVECEETLEREQEILDEHDDQVASLKVRLQLLCSSEPTPADDQTKISVRRLTYLEKSIYSIRDYIGELPDVPDDASTIEQYELQLANYRSDLRQVHDKILMIDDESSVENELSLCSRLEKVLFESSIVIRKSRRHLDKTGLAAHNSGEGSGVRLPKLAVPTFDGNILNWRQFWEQFNVSIHQRTNLSDSEKLVYLQHALQNGSAKPIIDGLSQSGEQYEEAIDCLMARFDRPRILHQAHVKMLVDSPAIREGSGKELRRLHDISQQHIRALKAMGQEPSPSFITSLIELKLDSTTMFEWQRHSQEHTDVPHYREILEFLDHRAQASEVSAPIKNRSKADLSYTKKQTSQSKSVTSLPVNSQPADSKSQCVLCPSEKHPLYTCVKFRQLPYDQRMSIIKANNLCMNCLGKRHYSSQCKSLNRCRKCQGPHHTLLHLETRVPRSTNSEADVLANTSTIPSFSNRSLLMTCEVLIIAPSGVTMKAKALLDSGSSASFVSERLTQSLRLERSRQQISVSGIGSCTSDINIKSVARVKMFAENNPEYIVEVNALVIPRVVRDLPVTPITSYESWNHISGIHLADPKFHSTGRIDLLLGIDVFVKILQRGRREGPPGTPTAIQTRFGWVLCGNVNKSMPIPSHEFVTSCHSSVKSNDDILHRFWELEQPPTCTHQHLSHKEQLAVRHFEECHKRTTDGQFIVPLMRETNNLVIGESRSQAVRRFISLERSLNRKNQFQKLDDVIQEYFELRHAEPVPFADISKPVERTFYLPIHAVYKQNSTTTKVRAVFDASAKSTSGVSLNDTLINGPTIHSPLIDVLLRFRLHRVAVTADVSKMYRAVHLAPDDRDFHRFVWRSSTANQLRDYRMTRVTFGVRASSFVANMAVRQNADDFANDLPLAADAVRNNIYVDDCLGGADNADQAISLYHQLIDLFDRGGFLLRKWNTSDPKVLEQIEPKLRDATEVINLTGGSEYAKTLGLEWNTANDHFRITITEPNVSQVFTKRVLVSNVAKIFDVLGWLSPTIIKMKILLQHLWEDKLEWDDPIPSSIQDEWSQWSSELKTLSNCHISRYFFPKNVQIINVQLHGFSDASQDAYAAVVYIRGEDLMGRFHTGLVLAKTKVAPLKRISIPRLELCGAYLLAQLLEHVKGIYNIPITNVYSWTDSTIVLNWLQGSSRRFKPFVGNRVSSIVDVLPPNCWRHVQSNQNPADSASRGIYPSELIDHKLWWKGPEWLVQDEGHWPKPFPLSPNDSSIDEKELCVIVIQSPDPLIPIDRYSSFSRFQRVTAWIYRFMSNCRHKPENRNTSQLLTVEELSKGETYWICASQSESFPHELSVLKQGGSELPKRSQLRFIRPFLDSHNVIRVGGRISNSQAPYTQIHPIVLHGRSTITRLIIQAEHQRMLHASPRLLCASISLRFHIINLRRAVKLITRNCCVCRRYSGKVLTQQQGQLPSPRLMPGPVFERVGLDFAGPFNVKYGYIRKPTIVKAYICLFVSFTVKAVHLEIVSNLTTEAFIAALRRFVSRRGLPTHIWSDHGTNFVGARREISEMYNFLRNQHNNTIIGNFCSQRNIDWSFIPERAPHFGGLWEAAVKSMKLHLRRITSDVRLTYEELHTIACQIEACLNSRPLIRINHNNDDVCEEVLTPAHFLIGKSLTAIPDQTIEEKCSISVLRRWELCQNVIQHFWKRWSTEYLTSLNKYSKWPQQHPNIAVDDIVVLRDETLFPTSWPLARVIEVYPGEDGLIRVVKIKTSKGTYKRPITKLVILPTKSSD